ncbi:MAG: alanine racemase [Eubacterium sp.]|nr:alanine racemase [Eubacterium sp.]
MFMYQRNYAKIDLDAIEYNTDRILEKLDGRAKLLAVIKADAYGHGAVEVAHFLKDRCDFFGVASVEEAAELYRAGIKTPILILGYVSPKQYEEVVSDGFRIPVFSLETAKALSAEAVRQGRVAKFHFCIDTGMSRIGFQVNEKSADLCSEICALDNIEAEGLFSHFATADEKDLTKTLAQREKFVSFVKMLEQRGIDIPIKHLYNSAGIMVFDEYFDMVRSGIITYGLYPSGDVDKSLLELKPALEWKSHITHIKTLEKGREISYGGTYITEKDTVVATVPVGYADGYPRLLSNKGRVLVNGKSARILGRVCMDQLMIDITGIDGVSVEDEVTLVGRDGGAFLPVEEVAALAGTINYELVCSLSRRVPKAYYRHGELVKFVEYLR